MLQTKMILQSVFYQGCKLPQLALLLLTCACSPISFSLDSLSEQRYKYELAKAALAKGDQPKFDQLYSQLNDYPLLPYLDYRRQVHNLRDSVYAPVETAILKHKGTYVGDRLHREFVYHLGQRNRIMPGSDLC